MHAPTTLIIFRLDLCVVRLGSQGVQWRPRLADFVACMCVFLWNFVFTLWTVVIQGHAANSLFYNVVKLHIYQCHWFRVFWFILFLQFILGAQPHSL